MTRDLLNNILNCFDGVDCSDLPETVREIKYSATNNLTLLDLGEKLGTTLPDYHSGHYIRLTDEISLSLWWDGCGKEISWSDTGEQPTDGWYLVFSFPVGAYMFHSGYPKKSFDGFFEELKSYGARYSDTVNSNLYFTLDSNVQSARNVFRNYKTIYKKWRDAAQKEVLEDQIREAEESLRKLKEKQ